MCGKGFGTDLPLVNSQVEEHNIFHNEVMAIGPHITKEGNKVSSLAPYPARIETSCPEGMQAAPRPGLGWVGAQTHG